MRKLILRSALSLATLAAISGGWYWWQTARFVETTDTEGFANASDATTKAWFVETIGNPRFNVPDLEALARLYWQAIQVAEPTVLDEAEMARVIERFRHYGPGSG